MQAEPRQPHASQRSLHGPRRFASILALGGAFLAHTLAQPAACLAQSAWQQTEFMIGTWEDPVTPQLHSTDVHYYQQAKDAYFNLLTGTVFHSSSGHFLSSYYSPGSHVASFDAANTVGLQVLLTHLQHTGVPGETAPAFDPTIPPNIFSMYDLAGADALTPAQNDALLGYNLWDEPNFNAANASFIKSWVSAIHADNAARADGHQRIAYLNLFPGCGDYTCYPAAVSSLTNDADPNRQLDVVSTDLYPFSRTPVDPTLSHYYWTPMRDLKAVMGSRPFWIISMVSPSAGGGAASNPDDNQLRFMSFCPAAAGAKGILWFDYREPNGFFSTNDYPILGADIPVCKYYRLATINHYLHDVVGPVAMSVPHVGVFQQANVPPMDPDASMSFVANASASNCPPSNLGNANFAVGVFRPTGTTGEYYLLIVNKALTAQSGTVTLRSPYAIGAAPSVVGYVGGSAYSPMGTGTTFAVSLAGGEGRMYHLSSAPTGDVALTAPLGGEAWRVGEPHTITWSPASTAVDINLFADVVGVDPEIVGPSTPIATGVTGGSYAFTMPNVSSRAAHIVLSAERNTSHNVPLLTAPVEPPGSTSWSFGSANCVMDGSITLGSNGYPMLAYTTFPHQMRVTSFDGSAWSTPATPYFVNFGSGRSASIGFDAANRAHIAHLTFLLGPSGNLTHTYRNSSNNWVNEDISTSAGAGPSSCALAVSSTGDVIVAYNEQSNGRLLSVRHKVGADWVEIGPMPPSNDPHDIRLVLDSANNAWVAFIDGEPALERLVVAKITPTSATASLVQLGQFVSVSLALDPNGRPAIAYTQEITGTSARALRYRAYTGTAWGPIKLVDGTLGTSSAVSLAFSGSTPNIAYVSNHTSKYATLNGTAWNLSTIVSSYDAAGPITLRFDASGHRWVSYFDPSLDQMRVVGPEMGGGDPPCDNCDPPPILRAITLRSNNPVRVGDALLFDLRLPRSATIEMSLFDVSGRRVSHLAERRLAAGPQQFRWVPDGIRPGAYFLRIRADGESSKGQRLIMLQ